MVVPILRPKVINGVFCVPKQGTDSLRLIIDARSANDVFVEPPHVELPTPDLLARMIPEPSRPLFVAKVDLDNFYHRLRLPEWMRSFFALPAVTAGEVGLFGAVVEEDGVTTVLRSSDMIYPACTTLPMGWSHSVFVAQRAHEHLVDTRTELQRSDRIMSENDFRIGNRVRHHIYIDDLAFFGHDSDEVDRLQRNYMSAVESTGLLVKLSKLVRPSTTGVECIGLEVDGINHSIGVSPTKLYRLQCETDALIRRAQFGVTGIELSMLVGRWTWACMVARPALSVFCCLPVY